MPATEGSFARLKDDRDITQTVILKMSRVQINQRISCEGKARDGGRSLPSVHIYVHVHKQQSNRIEVCETGLPHLPAAEKRALQHHATQVVLWFSEAAAHFGLQHSFRFERWSLLPWRFLSVQRFSV
jgi:hypothetical protein